MSLCACVLRLAFISISTSPCGNGMSKHSLLRSPLFCTFPPSPTMKEIDDRQKVKKMVKKWKCSRWKISSFVSNPLIDHHHKYSLLFFLHTYNMWTERNNYLLKLRLQPVTKLFFVTIHSLFIIIKWNRININFYKWC